MQATLNRRHFLMSTAALAAVPSVNAFARLDKVRLGVIGTANRAKSNWTALESAGAEIVSICDVDETLATEIRGKHPKAAFHKDFRKLIDAKGIDAVAVSTADHTHFHAAYHAIQNGLHVYCEKPLTHTVGEARRLAKAAKEKKLVTQMGTQIHAGDNYRRVVELIQAGAIGKVKEVHTWVGTSYGEAGLKAKVPHPSKEIPTGFDYDLWLGPVTERPFSSTFHSFNWRYYWAFGGGALADMACHHMDLPFWALGLRHPKTVSAIGSPVSPEFCHEWCEVEYVFPTANGDVKLTWHDGGKKPDALLKQIGQEKWGGGSLFIGEKGKMLADYGKYKLIPDNQAPVTVKEIPKSIGHHKEFVEAVKTGGTTTCNFDYSGALTEAVLLGTVAYRLGKPITWDAENLKAVGLPQADGLINKQYRKGWEI